MILKRPLTRAEYENLLAECKRLRANYDALREDVHRQIKRVFNLLGADDERSKRNVGLKTVPWSGSNDRAA